MFKKIIEAIKNFRVKRGETNMDENQKKAVNYTDIVYLKQYLDQNFSKNDHNHDGQYAPVDHNHDDQYAPIDHNHDDKYADKMLTELELRKLIFRLSYAEVKWNELSRLDLVIYKEIDVNTGNDKYLWVSFPMVIFPDFGGHRIRDLYDVGQLSSFDRTNMQERPIKEKGYYPIPGNMWKFIPGTNSANGTWEPSSGYNWEHEDTWGVIRFEFANGGDAIISYFLNNVDLPKLRLRHSTYLPTPTL